MQDDIEKLIAAHTALKDALASETGATWKEFHSEMQYDFGELAFWILLYEDVSYEDAARTFNTLTMAHMADIDPLKAKVSLQKIYDDKVEEVSLSDENLQGLKLETPLLEARTRQFSLENNLVIEATTSKR